MDKDKIVSALNKLIETSKDGEYGFTRSAEHVSSAQLKQLFTVRASECRQAAIELQGLVTQYGGKAEDSGSASGALHRGWVAVKAKLAGYSDLAMLEECERGEDIGGDGVLAGYDRARRLDVLTRSLSIDLLNRSLLMDIVPIEMLRGLAMHALARFPPLRQALMQAGMGQAGPLPSLMRR